MGCGSIGNTEEWRGYHMNDKCFDYYFLDEGNFDNLESAKRKLAEKKKEVRDNTEKDKDTKDFYPKPEDLQNLPENSLFIKISGESLYSKRRL